MEQELNKHCQELLGLFNNFYYAIYSSQFLTCAKKMTLTKASFMTKRTGIAGEAN